MIYGNRVLALCLPVVIACSTKSEPAPTKPEDRLANARAMALAPSPGATPVDEKIAELERTAKNNSSNADAWVLLGRAWIQKARASADPGYYLHADACADLALEVKPQYSLALDLKAMVMMNDHRFAEALQLASTILAGDPDDLMALGVVSDAQLELGNFDAAVDAAQKMVDLKPNLPSYSRAAFLRWMTGDTQTAKQFIRHAMDAGLDQRDPEPGAWVIVEAAKMFLHEGDYEGAAAGFDRALLRFPKYPPALLGKARVELALGRFEAAIDFAKQSFEGSPLAETAWVWGDAAREAGREDEMRRAFAKAVELGRQGDKRTLAAFLAAENRDLDEALRAIEGELKHRGGPYTDDTYAWVLYRLGRIEEAKVAGERAIRHGTKDATLMYHAGAIRIAAGDKAGGVQLVRDALKLNPKFQPAAAREAAALIAANAM